MRGKISMPLLYSMTAGAALFQQERSSRRMHRLSRMRLCGSR